MAAAAAGRSDAVRLFLELGANPNASSSTGLTAFEAAVLRGNWEVVKLLVTNGAHARLTRLPHDEQNCSMTAFLQVIELLLQSGNPVGGAGECWNEILVTACTEGMTELVQRLLNSDSLTFSPKILSNALMAASGRGHAEIVEMLVNRGARVNAQDKKGKTPLMAACSRGYKDAARALLCNGANVDHASAKGNTALMKAAYYGHADVVQLLLDAGADPQLKNKSSMSALILAALGGWHDVVRILEALESEEDRERDRSGNDNDPGGLAS
jgi:ankyrin repeat protein